MIQIHLTGSHYRKGNETAVQQNIRVRKVHRHLGFTMADYKDDIAILQLEKPAILSDKVQPACLPTKDPVVGAKCYTSGKTKLPLYYPSPVVKSSWRGFSIKTEPSMHSNIINSLLYIISD